MVNSNNLTAGIEFGLRHGFKVCTGTRYMGGFIGNDKSKRYWLKDRTSTWEEKILQLPKQQGNIPMRVTPRWFIWSNRNVHFCQSL